jgi:hypothetical protein
VVSGQLEALCWSCGDDVEPNEAHVVSPGIRYHEECCPACPTQAAG